MESAYAIDVGELLDIQAARFLNRLPFGGVNISLYDRPAHKIKGIAGAGIFRGVKTRELFIIDGPNFVVPKSNKIKNDEDVYNVENSFQEPIPIRPLWLAKEFLQPLSESNEISQGILSELDSSDRHKVTPYGEPVPTEILMEYLDVKPNLCLKLGEVIPTGFNGYKDWSYLIKNVIEKKDQGLMPIMSVYTDDTAPKEIWSFPFTQRSDNQIGQILCGLLTLNNPSDKLFDDYRTGAIVIEETSRMCRQAASTLARYCFDRYGNVVFNSKISLEVEQEKAKLLDFILQIGETIQSDDPEIVLERLKKIETPIGTYEIENIHKRLIQMASQECESAELFVRELNNEKKKFRAMAISVSAVFIILTIEALIYFL